jgi:hypothetical protein
LSLSLSLSLSLPRLPTWTVLTLVFGTTLLSSAGQSAVRLCREPMVAEGIAKTEPVARRRAIDGWIEQASVYGPAYTAWRLASDKKFECVRANDQFVCRAEGRPCSIEQVVPPGWEQNNKKSKKEIGA